MIDCENSRFRTDPMPNPICVDTNGSMTVVSEPRPAPRTLPLTQREGYLAVASPLESRLETPAA